MDIDGKIEAAIIQQFKKFPTRKTMQIYYMVKKQIRNKYLIKEEVVRRIVFLKDIDVLIHVGRLGRDDVWRLTDAFKRGNNGRK